jgi:hypothetical protein
VAVGTCTGASEVVLVAPGADCSDMVDKDGINDDRSAVPLEGREATLEGGLPFPFVGSLSSSVPMKNRWDVGEVYKATSMIPKKRRPSIDEFGFRIAPVIRKIHSGSTSVDTAKRQVASGS